MNKTLKSLLDANLSISVIEFGISAFTPFVISEENESRKCIKLSKFINSDIASNVMYGYRIDELLPNNLRGDYTLYNKYHEVCMNEVENCYGEHINTFMIVGVSKKHSAVIFCIYYNYCRTPVIYNGAIPKSLLEKYGRDEIISHTCALIAASKTTLIIEEDIRFDGKRILWSKVKYKPELVNV